MTLGKHQDSSISAPDSAADDATLDIVRLLIETEARHAQAYPEQAGEAQGDAGARLAAGRVAPRRVTLAAQARARGHSAVSQGTASQPEPAPPLEDLRPRSLARGWFGWGAVFGRGVRPTALWAGGLRASGLRISALQGTGRLERAQIVQYAKLAGLVALGVVILFKPWLIPALFFMLVWLVLILFLVLGSSRISELSEALWGWYQAMRPARAEAVVVRLQRAADRVDGILARLPARVSDGIYTPDLGRSARDRMREGQVLPQGDPLDRLALRHGPAE